MFSGARVLVAGGTGTVGSGIVQALLKQGTKVSNSNAYSFFKHAYIDMKNSDEHPHTQTRTHSRTYAERAHAHARTHARTHARMHARTHAHTHTHTHTHVCGDGHKIR